MPREAADLQPGGDQNQGRTSSEVRSLVKLLATGWTCSPDGAATGACCVSNSGFSGCKKKQRNLSPPGRQCDDDQGAPPVTGESHHESHTNGSCDVRCRSPQVSPARHHAG